MHTCVRSGWALASLPVVRAPSLAALTHGTPFLFFFCFCQWFLGALADPDTVISGLPGSEDTAARTERATMTLRSVQPAVDQPMPWSEGVHGATSNRRARVERARVEDVIDRLRSQVLTRGIRVGEFFADSDRLRRGTVTRSKFRSALDNAGLVLSEGEYLTLMDAMRPDAAGSADLVRYRSLVRSLDGGAEEMEKNPTKRLQRPTLPCVTPAGLGAPRDSPPRAPTTPPGLFPGDRRTLPARRTWTRRCCGGQWTGSAGAWRSGG